MTKGEIRGLRQLAMAQGGDLSINPYTGLVEAGFLSKILPMVAMAAATYFTAGAAAPAFATALQGTALAGSSGLLAGAASGALIGGLGAGLQGGNVGKGALFGGIGGAITGGMGGYDSAPNVFSGMGETSNAVAQTGAQAGNVAATTGSTLEAANQAFAPGATGGFTPTEMMAGSGNPISSGYAPTSGFTPTEMAQGSFRSGAPMPFDTTTGTAQSLAPSVTQAQAAEASKTIGGAGSRLGGVSDSYYSGLGTGMMDTAKKAAILGAPGILAQGYGMTPEQQQLPTGEEEPSTLSRISPNFRAQEPAQPNPYYTAQETDYVKRPYGYAMGGIANSEFNQKDSDNPQTNYVGGGMPMYAGGGAIAFANRGIVQPLPRSSGADVGTYTDTDPNTAKLDAYNAALYRLNKARAKAGIKQPAEIKKAAVLGDVEEAAKGGIMQGHSDLGSYSDGGRMLKGPGDGMSDSIPGVIGKKQPARLADGEFVVPADVVSHLGNGSTDAGARKLYSMMDKIRKARTGKKKQAPQVKTDKYLPA
jgi:hypothetical protein